MCECIKTVNDNLSSANINTRIKVPFTMGDVSKCVVATEKEDSNNRKKPKTIFASFCPFCGEKY